MNKLRTLFWKENGSITLFAAMIMTCLILFFMVLIDISRILLFSRGVESTTKLAAKSVISAYDLALYKQYGLFGKGGTEGSAIAEKIIDSNLTTEMNLFDLTKSIRLVPIVVEDIEVYYDHYLGEYDELEQQINEEMKYKAPIDFSLEVAKTFMDMEEASQIANNLVSSLELLQELYEEREEALEYLLQLQGKLAKLEPANPLDQNFTSITGGYSSYIGNLQSEQSLFKDLQNLNAKPKLTALEKLEINKLSKQLNNVQQSINAYLTSSNQAVQKSEQNKRKIEQQLPEISLQIEETFNLARTLNTTLSIQYDILVMKQQENNGSTSTNTMTQALTMEFSSENLIRPASYFSAYEAELNKQLQESNQLIIAASSFTQAASSALNQPSLNTTSNTVLDQTYTSFSTHKSTFYQNYVSPGTIIHQREAAHNQLASTTNIVKKQKEEYKKLITNSNYITQLATIIEQLEKDKSSFDKVNQLYLRNLQRNIQINEQQAATLVELTDKGNKNAKLALGQFNTMLANMKRLIGQTQSHLYRNEYIIQRFDHLPLGKLEQLTKLNKDNINFHHQAVEYMMIGSADPAANITLVLGEIFAIRLAIRTIEGLIANKHLANPILIISAALLHGLSLALSDMNELFAEGKTTLSKYMKVDVTYPLYLRLLLNVHGLARASTLSRIVAVIEHDLNLDFMKVATSSIVAAKYKTKLWVLPSASNLNIPLTSDSLTEKGYYEKTIYASTSY